MEVSVICVVVSKLGIFNLSGCEIYILCELCFMCLGVIYWVWLDKMYYVNNKMDVKNIGFDDFFIYDELSLKFLVCKLFFEVFLVEEVIKVF